MFWLLLAACPSPEFPPAKHERVLIEPGPPVAGMAEGTLDFPMGAPMGGYSGRCRCLGGEGEVDNRDSAYVESFSSTAGIQTRARAHALWLENGDQDFVWLKADLIYAPDHLVIELSDRLSAATGRDLTGKVVLAVSHTHNAPGNWHQGLTWYLGGDRYNHEILTRVADSLEALALEAFDAREPAAIGLGYAQDWDPDDRVYSDRRGENNEVQFFDDIPAGSYKDPNLSLLRIDTAAGDPLGFFFNFGMHGTSLGGDNAMVSTDAPGHVELILEDRFDTPVVIAHTQAGGGDASPRGSDDGYARLESVGEYAADAIYALWENTPTSSEPIRIESITHSIDTDRDSIRVTRDGTVDWYYAPYDEDYEPDDIVYESDGSLSSPFDEFNTEYGGAFCGSDNPLIPGASVGSTVYPYSSCIRVDTISLVLGAFFDLEIDEVVLPLVESQRAQATTSRIGPLAIRTNDGEEIADDVLFGFFPGETVSVYSEQFRRRAASELGFEHTVVVGYAQDHEGYLLTPEDWLLGGYEPNINIWGPLQGEHIMEGMLDMSERWLLTDELEPHDPSGLYISTQYPETQEFTQELDETPAAGTWRTEGFDELWLPIEGLELEVQPPAELPRVAGIAQLLWEGGDPAVDLPVVTLERLEGDDWAVVQTPSGRPVNDTRPDIVTAHTPDPLYPYEDAQSHIWWAAWQAVGDPDSRMGLPLGTYRLVVEGKVGTGGDRYPYETSDYRLESDEFDVVEAPITVSTDGTDLIASVSAHDAGFRLIHLDGSSQGANPLDDSTLSWELSDGSVVDESPTWTVADQTSTTTWNPPDDAVAVEVTDLWGNSGRLEF